MTKEEKLEVAFQIDQKAENFLVPSFLIHPIIETAIKYGIKTSTLPLMISIKAKLINETLCLEICNQGI